LLITLFQIKPSSDSKVTEEEIKAIIQEGTEGGAIQEIEQDIVERVFNLGDRKVSSLMTHRNDIIVLRIEDSADKIKSIVNDEMHSVYPVVNHKFDVVGMVLLKDLFKCINKDDFKLADYIKNPEFLSENLSAYEALKNFKISKNHQGIVIDEYGQMQGLLTMNDLLEALVGDVSDFYADDFTFIQRADGSWLIDGQYPLPEFLRKFGLDDMADSLPFNTISGLILHELRRIPAASDTLNWLNFKIEIVDMDGARIDKVIVSLQA
jgi:putative hemolysin